MPKNLKRLLFSVSMVVFALALLVPITANAQVTISQIRVTVSNSAKTTVWCDTTTTCPNAANQIWNLGGGIVLSPNESLVLTQTGVFTGVGGNFDTSDLVDSNGLSSYCSAAQPCTVKVELNTGSGLQQVYNSNAAVALNNFNSDTGASNHLENAPFVLAASGANYTLSFGYADNEHNASCLPNNCFPNPFNGTGGTNKADNFLGAGINGAGICPTTTPPNCFDAGAILIVGKALPPVLTGRMTGGGSVFTTAGVRVTHGFELHCNPADGSNNLEINWGGGNNFHLTSLTAVTCIDDPAIAPPPPPAGFDTYIATGIGTCNNQPATISFTLTDAGEPGTQDTASYQIIGTDPACNLTVSGNLDKGNQQAHKEN